MGRTKRFSVLDKAIGKYKAAASTPTDPIAVYKTFKSKGTGYNYTVKGKAQGAQAERQILPFGVPSSGNKIYIAVSGRVLEATALTTNGIVESDLALEALTNAAVSNGSFLAAKAVIYSGKTSTTTEKSKITGVNYQKGNGESYSYPFGQSSGTRANVLGAQQHIISKVITGKRTVTFKPERFFA